LPSVDKINKKNTAEGRKLRAERLTRAAYDLAQSTSTTKLKLDDFAIKPSKIPVTDIVFRVMTWEHIPTDVAKSKKTRAVLVEDNEADPLTEYDDVSVALPSKFVKVNFPPFQHYKIDENGVPYCVGKSHWQGDLIKGNFNRDHGTMTRTLAHMLRNAQSSTVTTITDRTTI